MAKKASCGRAGAGWRTQQVGQAGIGRGGKEKLLELKGEKLRHHVGRRARMGRVLPEKLKPPMDLAVPPKLQLDVK